MSAVHNRKNAINFITEIHIHDTDACKRTHVTERQVSDDELAISFRHDTYTYRITNLFAALKKGGRNGGDKQK
jgi:hypothetical protein